MSGYITYIYVSIYLYTVLAMVGIARRKVIAGLLSLCLSSQHRMVAVAVVIASLWRCFCFGMTTSRGIPGSPRHQFEYKGPSVF